MNASPVQHLLWVLAAGLTVGCGPSSSGGDSQSGSSEGTSMTGEEGTAGTGSPGTATGTGEGSDGSTGSSGGTGVDEGSSSSGASDTGNASCAGHAGTVVYANFEGVTLTPGPDDSRNDVSLIVQEETEFAPYGGNEGAEMIAIVRDRFEDFDVCVTDTRPTEGDYTMVVVTPTNPIGSGVFGIAGQDCGNANPNNIVFEFTDAADGAAFHGPGIARILGFSFGLDAHEDDMQDLPHVFFSETAVFQDACMQFGNPEPLCEHLNSCAGGQNSYQELLATLGPAGG